MVSRLMLRSRWLVNFVFWLSVWGTAFPAGALAQNEVSSLFGHSYALVVGIDDYSDSTKWPPLNYAAKDANAVADYLEKQGFDVTPLINGQATRSRIISEMQDIIAPRLKEGDRFIFFFAGHGFTDKIGVEAFGYIIPVDGGTNTSGYIAMEDIRAQSLRMNIARHQLFIFDACYGGMIGGMRGSTVSPDIPNYLQVITSRAARQFITAGGADERVLDGGHGGHSFFTHYLLEGLQEGEADLNKDGIITFGELTGYLTPAASNEYRAMPETNQLASSRP